MKKMKLHSPDFRQENIAKLADVTGSTTQLINAAVNSAAEVFIVATDNGILHKMRALPGQAVSGGADRRGGR